MNLFEIKESPFSRKSDKKNADDKKVETPDPTIFLLQLARLEAMDANLSLETLREKVKYLPTICYLFLAVKEFENNPTLETVTKVSFPLFKAGIFRLNQDSLCFTSKDDEEKSYLESVFLFRLETKIFSRFPATSLNELFRKHNINHLTFVKDKIIEVAEESLTKKLPEPFAFKDQKLHPQNIMDIHRRAYAYSILCTMKEDVLRMCRLQNDVDLMSALIKDNDGMPEEEKLKSDLANGKIVPILIALWSERDRAKRLNWLREQSSSPHAVLLFELAMAEFNAKPTVETLLQVSYPLIKTASLRVRQDVACYADQTLANLYVDFEVIYRKALENLCQKHLKSSLKVLLEKDTVSKPTIVAKFQHILQLTKDNELPLPDWILGSGKVQKPEDRFPNIGFLDRCKTARLASVQNELTKLLTPPKETYTRVLIDQD